MCVCVCVCVCVSCKMIFSNKLDLLEATCFIIIASFSFQVNTWDKCGKNGPHEEV